MCGGKIAARTSYTWIKALNQAISVWKVTHAQIGHSYLSRVVNMYILYEKVPGGMQTDHEIWVKCVAAAKSMYLNLHGCVFMHVWWR
jgi:hypothetical protein